jgi:hypothetical protein
MLVAPYWFSFICFATNVFGFYFAQKGAPKELPNVNVTYWIRFV